MRLKIVLVVQETDTSDNDGFYDLCAGCYYDNDDSGCSKAASCTSPEGDDKNYIYEEK